MVEMDGNLSRENEYLPIDVHEQHASEVNDRVHKTFDTVPAVKSRIVENVLLSLFAFSFNIVGSFVINRVNDVSRVVILSPSAIYSVYQ